MSESSGSVRQQIGEILGTVRALSDQMKERQADAKEENRSLRSEIGNVKHEQRAELQIISLRLEKQEKETGKLAEQLDTVTERVDSVSTGVGELRGPVTELVNMKRRFVAFAAFGMSIMAVLWALAEPLWSWVVHRILGGPAG